MPAARKPKKVFIQFAVALVVAAVLGVGAIVIGFTIIQGMSVKSAALQEDLLKEKKKLEDERRRLADEATKAVRQPINVTFKVVQASADIVPGQPITKDMVQLIETDERPEPMVASTISQVIGHMVKKPIYKGEPVDQGKLLDNSGFINVEPGMRAITIQVDNIGGLSGALAPGVHVDVLTTLSSDDKTIAKTLLQNVPVISVGDNAAPAGSPRLGNVAQQVASNLTQGSSSSGGPVTLAVKPKHAEMLTLANQIGRFHLTLRNFSDKSPARLAGSDMTELLTGLQPAGMQKNLPKAPPEPSEAGFHNVNYSPQSSLPAPQTAPKGEYSMKIYRGNSPPENIPFK